VKEDIHKYEFFISFQATGNMVSVNIVRGRVGDNDIVWTSFQHYFPPRLWNKAHMCDMIKGNESDVANIDFEL
jgi:hypothetical protein